MAKTPETSVSEDGGYQIPEQFRVGRLRARQIGPKEFRRILEHVSKSTRTSSVLDERPGIWNGRILRTRHNF